MAKEINSVQLSGNLGKAPEYRQVGSGMATFSLAVNRYIPRDGGKFEKQTAWFRCVAWGEVARAIVEKLGKGDRVMVQGRLDQGTYEAGGRKVSSVEVVATSFSLLKDAQATESQEEAEDEEEEPPIEAPKPKKGIRGVREEAKGSARSSQKRMVS